MYKFRIEDHKIWKETNHKSNGQYKQKTAELGSKKCT